MESAYLYSKYKNFKDREKEMIDTTFRNISKHMKNNKFVDNPILLTMEFNINFSFNNNNKVCIPIEVKEYIRNVLESEDYKYLTNAPSEESSLNDVLIIYKTKESKLFDYKELAERLGVYKKYDDMNLFIINAKKALEISNSDNHQSDSEYAKSKLIKEKIFEIGAKIYKAARNGEKKLVYDCNFSDKDDVIEYITNRLRKEGYNVVEKTIPFADCRYEAETCKYFIISWDNEEWEE